MSAPLSFRLDDQINEALEAYVTKKGISKAEFIRSAIMEKLEDDYDIMMADRNFELWEQDAKKVKTLEEMLKLYG
ncbi:MULTISPECIES: type II toxin-antitoxin system RelB family antitoxin [Macrococcoides]|uniref:Ribbon-helix-helix protein, CopG family n=1 Tax=Macrococcoides goetzii TaxID=1891097 RepID=A0A395GAU9_9STAP|nr:MULTISPECIES: DUF6290 family protein [Macrococcus]QRN48655.1 ribbon-helix-helix protein, CopG family [Macrococcus bohemicus]QUR94597.1 ribbon-helix-helix protein, CopG family [Macrococcus canis]QYA44844.1 ribbon-helix-helix domain-containing protein [Macrococcus bohemicus]RAI81072.1 ribbon-helix-helix protein, CopG family [Macrococcus goetzii]